MRWQRSPLENGDFGENGENLIQVYLIDVASQLLGPLIRQVI